MSKSAVLIVACAALTACTGIEGTRLYSGPESVVATNTDKGDDAGVFTTMHPAVAYTPDGCQVWIIDDGAEGYASNRFNPRTGRPVCNDRFPPGTIIGNYETDDPGIRDDVPGPSGIALVIPTQ